MAGPARRTSVIFNVAVFIILEVASLCILSSEAEIQGAWISRGFNNVKASVWGRTDKIREYLYLREENDRLAAENRRLMQTIGDSAAAVFRRNAGWSAWRDNFVFTGAGIVTMTFRSQHNYLIIDKGFLDGVEQDDGIITSSGVIGVVRNAGAHYSYAMSYANQDMVISAKIGMNGTVGSMVWDGSSSNGFILSDIPLHTPAEKGDTVFTSGFSSIFPRDIPLGVVESKRVNNGNSANIRVTLFEDFRRIHNVFVVKNPDRDEIMSLTR